MNRPLHEIIDDLARFAAGPDSHNDTDAIARITRYKAIKKYAQELVDQIYSDIYHIVNERIQHHYDMEHSHRIGR